MFLEKPAFPVLVEIAEAEGQVSKLLDSKNWHTYQFSKVSVLYVPYYFFSYDIFDEASGKTIFVSKGKGALNVHLVELEHKIASLAGRETGKLDNEITHNYHYDVLRPKISEKEARRIIAVRLAADRGVSRKHVLLSGVEMLFVAVWILNFSLEGNSHVIRMNATTGEVLNEDIIPVHEKTRQEIALEAVSEISDPRNWPGYIVDSASEAASFVSEFTAQRARTERTKTVTVETKETKTTKLSSADLLVITLGLIAILVIFWFFNRF